jgi:hypothetical protein
VFPAAAPARRAYRAIRAPTAPRPSPLLPGFPAYRLLQRQPSPKRPLLPAKHMGNTAGPLINRFRSLLFTANPMPMTTKRIPIPKPVERELLFRNQSVCCICQKSGIQIHHIDNDPANNRLTNLCVLCVDHHAQASSVGTMTKGLDVALLRKYKFEWEGIVLRRRQQSEKKARGVLRRSDKQQLRFEIQKNRILSPRNKVSRSLQSAL